MVYGIPINFAHGEVLMVGALTTVDDWPDAGIHARHAWLADPPISL
jgi:branched-subunit amino acid ABC-type transport system permease component